MANLTGLLAARHEQGDGRRLPLGPDPLVDRDGGWPHRLHRRAGPAHGRRRWPLTVEQVAAAVAEDRAAGRTPTIVVATAGTTNTGAVDPLRRPGRPVRRRRPLAPRRRRLRRSGCARTLGAGPSWSGWTGPTPWSSTATSGSSSPTTSASCWSAGPAPWSGPSAMNPEYLADVTAADGEVDLRNRSPGAEPPGTGRSSCGSPSAPTEPTPWARPSSTASAWPRRPRTLLAADAGWEVVTPAQLGIVTFARVAAPPTPTTCARGRPHRLGLRRPVHHGPGGPDGAALCTINPRTSVEDLAGTLDRLATTLA